MLVQIINDISKILAALWLNLEDVYWARQGRVSVDAVVLFGALLSVGLWGRGFFEALLNEVLRMLKLEN